MTQLVALVDSLCENYRFKVPDINLVQNLIEPFQFSMLVSNYKELLNIMIIGLFIFDSYLNMNRVY